MNTVLLLLVFAGLSWGFQAPLHYKYKYFGSVSTGIPELSNQASGWAIKADVNVFVEKIDGTAIFQLHNVRTVEFNDNLGCDSRGEISDELFETIKDADLSKAIEAPFKAHLYYNEEKSIEYPEDKYRWLVNFRKGIATIFRNEVINGNMELQYEDTIANHFYNGRRINVFTVSENTIFGKCNVHYSANLIPKYLSVRMDNEYYNQMETDVQRNYAKLSPKAMEETLEESDASFVANHENKNLPEFKKGESLIRVIRTVNFDQCEEMVGFTKSSGEFSEVTGGQFNYRRGRSSVSELIFRGKPGTLRLERATVEGATTLAPFGFKTEVIQARTNQTLRLVSVTVGDEVPTLPEEGTQSSKTWMHEVWSSFEPPKHSKPRPWVVYTGEKDAIKRFQQFGVDHFTTEQTSEIKNAIIAKISKASKILTDMEQEEEEEKKESPSKLMKDASYLFKFVTKEIALEIFKVFFDKDLLYSDTLARKLVIDAAASSGYIYALKAVMVYIKEGKIPDAQIMTVFMTLTSNAECTCAFPDMLDWLITTDIKEKPFVTPTLLINFAHAVHDMCIHPNARNLKFAGATFEDIRCDRQMIMERFQPLVIKLLEDEEEWVNIVGIEVLKALEDPNSFEILAPYIEGKICSNKVRIYAIYAMDNWNLDDYEYLKYPIVDMLTNIYNDIGENVAVREAALIVVSTWSPDASFYQTIARTSWREPSKRFASLITSLIKFDADTLTEAAYHAVEFTKPTAPLSSYSNMFLSSRGDEKQHIRNYDSFDILKSKNWFEIMDISFFSNYEFAGRDYTLLQAVSFLELKKLVSESLDNFNRMNIENQNGHQLAKEYYDKVKKTIKSSFDENVKDDTIEIYLNFLDHIHLFLPFNNYTSSKLPYMHDVVELMTQLNKGYDLVLGKYFNPLEYTLVHPTEMGFPLFISSSTPSVISDISHTTLTTKALSLEILKKSELSMESLTSISTEFRSSLSVLLPWNQKLVKAGVTSSRDIILPQKSVLRYSERNENGHQSFVHLDIKNLYKKKFSVVKASNTPYTTITSILPLGDTSSKAIISKSVPKEMSIPIPNKYTGLDFHLNLKSEAAFPFTLFSFDELKSSSSPLLFYAYASPTTKYWYADLEFDPVSSATKNINLEFMTGTSDKKTEGKDGVETPEYANKKGGYINVNSLKVNLDGDQHRNYEILLTSTKSKISESRKAKKFQLSFNRSPIPDIDSKPASVCFDVQKSFPIISKLHTFESILKENLDKEVKAEITLGCTGEPVLVLKGSYHISDEWKNKYQNNLQEVCDFDENDSLYTFNHHAVYDDLKFTYTWEKVCDPGHYPLMTKFFTYGQELLINGIFRNKCGKGELDRKIEVDINRCPVNGNWYINIHRDDNEVSYKNVPHSNAFNTLFDIAEKDDEFYPDHFTTFNLESDRCIVGENKIRTFDGYTLAYNSSQCWIVAAKTCFGDRMLLTRPSQDKSTIPEAKYIDTVGLVIEYSKNTLTVNGKVIDSADGREEIKGDDGNVMVVLYKKNNYYLAKFSEDSNKLISKESYISFKDKIEIHFNDFKCGLCGNNDGEPENDLIGPQKCYYRDLNTLVASWTVLESNTCDSNTLKEVREKAEKYQESCTTYESYVSKCKSFDRVCMSHEWNITYAGNNICVSSTPIPYCASSCDVTEYHDVLVRFYCWPRDSAPDVLKNEKEYTGLNVYAPLGYEPHWEEDRYVSFPKVCKEV